MSLATSFRAGFRSAWGGARTRAVVATSLGTVLFAVLVAVLERRGAHAGSADRALATCFRLLVPLSIAAISTLVVGPRNLRDATWPVARFGHPKEAVALGQLGLVTAVGALTTFVAITLAVLVAHVGVGAAASSLTLGSDLFTSGWIALLVGALYSAWLTLGACFGKLGGARAIVLVLDFVLGDTGFFGAVMPRGVAYNLIGHASVMDLGQRSASAIGLATVVLLWGLVALRTRD
ncbi:MAG TPA: hypothetical protein VL400_20240 [Polyangiaceae bacterium]|jgi:hypothetical protein|nr:hypothetical protein [Polyangiaceae bacterium]